MLFKNKLALWPNFLLCAVLSFSLQSCCSCDDICLNSAVSPDAVVASTTDLNVSDAGSGSYTWKKVSPKSVIVDDYSSYNYSDIDRWYYSRIGTDRGEMGQNDYCVVMGRGSAAVNVCTGWAGVWTSLIHRANDNDALDPSKLLGPYVKNAFQVKLSGLMMKWPPCCFP